MTTAPPQSSSTPILDLQSPLPTSYGERITGRFAAPFLASVSLIVLTENYAFLMVPFGIVLIFFLSALAHELGHLVAGWSVGLRFDGVTVGPFIIKRLRTGLVFRYRHAIWSGLAFMSLQEVSRIRRRELVSIAGGPCASLLCGAVALIGGEVALTQHDSSWVTFFEFFGVYSLFIGVLSFFPYRVGPYAGDGVLLRALVRSKDEGRQLIAACALGALRNKCPEGVNWNRKWMQTAYGQPGLVTQYHVDWYSYSMAQDTASAARLLERCLSGSTFLEREDRDSLIAEVVKFTAWDQNDADKAQRWYARLRYPERLGLLSRIRMEVALKSAIGEFDQALQEWQKGFRLIQQSPSGVTTREYEKYWQAWRDEIDRRWIQRYQPLESLP